MPKWLRGKSAYVWIGVLALISLAGFLYSWFGRLNEKNDEIWLDVAKDCLTFFMAATAGVVLKRIVEIARDQRKEAARQRIFKRHMLSDLKSVYDDTETARLLIRSHKSAKTYGEEIRRIIHSRVRLSGVKRALESRTVDFGISERGLKSCVLSMRAYVGGLEHEYRMKYLEVSREQKVDEVINKAVAENKAKNTAAGEWSSVAWQSISSAEKFPALDDLLSHGKVYQKHFREPLDAASIELRNQIASNKISDSLKEYEGIEAAPPRFGGGSTIGA